MTFKQKLIEYRILINTAGDTATFMSPQSGYFPIHPDCFDLKEFTVLNNKSLAHIKYSFALANGMICFEKTFDGASKKVHWINTASGKPALLLLNFLDANGYPVVLHPVEASIDLLPRTGSVNLLKDNTNPGDPAFHNFQKTIPGISPGNISEATLHTLSYTTINWDRKEKQLYGQNNASIGDINEALQKPFWLNDDGKVIVDEKSPTTVYGISKGGWLSRKNEAPNKVALKSKEILHNAETVYHFITLEVNSDHWDYKTQYEERETHLSSSAEDTNFTVSERKFSSDNGQLLSLPATDYLFGASNIYKPSGVIESEIQNKIRVNIESVNKGFDGFQFIAEGQTHIQGFSRSKSGENKLSQSAVYLHPVTRAANPLDVISTPSLLIHNPVIFRHGDISTSSQTDHAINAVPATAPVDNIANRLRKIQQIWNDYLFFLQAGVDEEIRKLARAVWTLRRFFENLAEETDQFSSRVSITLADGTKEAYRLSFDKITTNVVEKEKWLLRVKTIVNGDYNKIPGLGKRLFKIKKGINQIKKEITDWTIADLDARWNVGCNVSIDNEDKVICALLDFVYKQCDRTLLNQLLELVVLADISAHEVGEAVAAAKELLRFADIITKETIEEIEAEIVQLGKDGLNDVQSIITEAAQGADPYLEKIKLIWNEIKDKPCAGIISQEVYARYGSKFDLKTYKLLVSDISSGNIPIKETANKILKCLEKKLKAQIKHDLVTAWGDLSKTWDDALKAWIKNTFAQYEEDITAFYLFVLRVIEIKDKVQSFLVLFNKIKNAQTPEDIIALGSDPAFKEVYNLLADAISEEYGDQLKKVSTTIDEEIRNQINEASEKIVSITSLILNIQKDIQLWEEKIIPKLQSSIDKLKTEWISFVDDFLKDNPDELNAFLEAIVNYVIEKYILFISIPDLRVEPPQYIVYAKHIAFNTDNAFSSKLHKILKRLHLQNFKLCDLGDKDRQWNFSLSENSIYVVKLGNDMDFTGILNEINNSNKKPGMSNGPLDGGNGNDHPLQSLIDGLHPEINTKDWRGLLIINPLADVSKDNLIRDLLGKAHISMQYAAIGGSNQSHPSTPDNPFPGLNIYARVKEEISKMQLELKEDNDAELTFIKFDAVIRNTTLESGNALLELNYKKFLGLRPSKELSTVQLYGTVPPKAPGDKSPRDFEFGVTFHPPFALKNEKDDKLGFIKEVSLSGIRAIRQAGRSVLDINAVMKFAEFGPIDLVQGLILRNFYIVLPANSGKENPAGKPRGVSFDIGSIEFTINIPRPINFLGVELLPKAVGYIKNLSHKEGPGFVKDIIWINKTPANDDNEFSYLKIDVDFGKLPRLGGGVSGSLTFDAYIGFKSKGGVIHADKSPYFGVQRVVGKEISIDLFRFISLYIETLVITSAVLVESGQEVTFIGARNVKLKILDWSPLPEASTLSLAFLHNKPKNDDEKKSAPQKAFIGAYSNVPEDGTLKIFWLLIAQNLVVNNDVLNRLISPALNESEEQVNRFVKEIFDGVTQRDNAQIRNLTFDSKPGWLFGASFAVGEILDRCSLILHEDHYYGIMLSSKQDWFKQLFGTDKFALSYIPGPTKQQDRFRVEFGLPALEMISNLKSGLVALEFAINKDFLVDFGFPWRSGNTYLWYRTFSLISGIYETRFGFYFEKRTAVTPSGTELTIGAGIAISYGYGLRASAGFAYAEAGIAITVILMGAVTFGYTESVLKSSIRRIEVTGVIGIYGYVRGGINYWIITAEIKAEIIAALAGQLIYQPQGNSSLTFSATLSVKFFASARLKLGFVKITVSISGQLDYGVSGRIALN